MKAWEVVALVKDGEFICEDCIDGKIERIIWDDGNRAQELMEDNDINVLFASDAQEDDCCGECGNRLLL